MEMMDDEQHFIVSHATPMITVNIPQPAGRWELFGGFVVTATRKPNWLHRLMTRLLLGWKWTDN